MINMDSWGHSYLIARDDIYGFGEDEILRRHWPRMFCIDQEPKLGDRRQSDTVVVLTINRVD